MDTQSMSAPLQGHVSKVQEHPPYIPKKITIFTDMERKELKELINEILDERDKKVNKTE